MSVSERQERYRAAHRDELRRREHERRHEAAGKGRGRAAPHLPGQGKGSPRAAVRAAATPTHLLARCIDAERQLRVAPRWARIEGAPPQWREYVGG